MLGTEPHCHNKPSNASAYYYIETSYYIYQQADGLLVPLRTMFCHVRVILSYIVS